MKIWNGTACPSEIFNALCHSQIKPSLYRQHSNYNQPPLYKGCGTRSYLIPSLQMLSHEQWGGLVTSTPHGSFSNVVKHPSGTFEVFSVKESNCCCIPLLRHQTDLIGTFLRFHQQMACFRNSLTYGNPPLVSYANGFRVYGSSPPLLSPRSECSF